MGCSFWPGSPSRAAKQSTPSNNHNALDLVGMSGPDGLVFAKHFGINEWKEAVE